MYKLQYEKLRKWTDRIPFPAKYILFRPVKPSFAPQIPWNHNTCICMYVWMHYERWRGLRNASTSTDDRAIHLCRMTKRMDRYTRLTCFHMCAFTFSLFLQRTFPFLLQLLLIYYFFSAFLSHSTIEHAPSCEFKTHSAFAYLFDRKYLRLYMFID